MVYIFTIHISYKTLTRCFPGWFCNNQIYGVGVMHTVYPKKYAHGFVVLCFVVVMQSFIMNSHEVFIHIHQGCFAGTGAIVRLPQCQWSKPDGYGKISQCIPTTKHSKAKTVCIFLGIYYICVIKVIHHCFRQSFVPYSAPWHYLHQFWLIANNPLFYWYKAKSEWIV